ncbi:hypothetical protein [Enhygromyxa salina]|uniref:Uncharacterized protein n=1 Tax=Enhygromyxa salina TaxID=215803 RepID=A0A2S9Y3H9_9BACT|nr:hypothetical protein [Enhygromyxa salina]PRP99635.1 hypothetical protein ENSA7_62750 [Enhygromyxa salina]
MSPDQPEGSGVGASTQRALPAWLVHLRRVVNVVVPLALAYLMVLGAVPREHFEGRMRDQHDKLVAAMKQISLSQTWSMYAPDPGRGHFYMRIRAYDADGTVRELDETFMAEHGWGTARAWNRSRLDIWQHAVTRRIDQVNRNRTWYLRGVCLREARRGYDVQRLEMTRVYRRIRSPDQVREGKDILGPAKIKKAQDGSCRVRIIQDMIELDRARRGEPEADRG